MKHKTLFMTEVAIFSALALLLDLVSGFVFSRIWPQGGSISIAMVPIFLMGYRWGIKGGMLTGFLLGLLQIVSGTAWIMTPLQGFIDYYLAFTVVGISGVFMSKFVNNFKDENRTKAKLYGIGGMFLGSFLRFLCHFTSGFVFLGSFAPKGQSVVLYSFIYNGTYMLFSFVLSAIVVMMLYSAASSVLLKKAY